MTYRKVQEEEFEQYEEYETERSGNYMNRPWSNEEEMLLIDLYIYSLSHTKEEYELAVLALSKSLRKMAINAGEEIEASYRNPTGINMKIQNIYFLATGGTKDFRVFRKKIKKFMLCFKQNTLNFPNALKQSKRNIKLTIIPPVLPQDHKLILGVLKMLRK